MLAKRKDPKQGVHCSAPQVTLINICMGTTTPTVYYPVDTINDSCLRSIAWLKALINVRKCYSYILCSYEPEQFQLS